MVQKIWDSDTNEELLEVFHVFDKNENDYISVAELHHVMKTFMEKNRLTERSMKTKKKYI